MTEDTFKKICSCFKYCFLKEVNIQDLKDNLYELQKNEKYHVVLNNDEKTKHEYDCMLDEFIKKFEENQMVLKNKDYVYILDSNPIFKKTEKEFNVQERKLYLGIVQDFIKLNCKKYQEKDETKVYTIKQKDIFFDIIQEIIEFNCKKSEEKDETKVYTIKRSIRIPKNLL